MSRKRQRYIVSVPLSLLPKWSAHLRLWITPLQNSRLPLTRKENCMSVLRKSNKKVSSRQQIDIREIKDGVLILPNHRYRVVLHVSPVNFELRSEDEQDAIIETYESFLNSVGVPLQVLI